FIYSIFILHYPMGDVMSVFRIYSIYLIFIVFREIPINKLHSFFQLLMKIVLVQCTLFILQIITGGTILTGNNGSLDFVINTTSSGFNRYYNIPPFALVGLAYYMFGNVNMSKFKQALYVGICFLCLLAPLHRTQIVATILSIGLFILLKGNIKKWFFYALLITLIIIPLASTTVLSERIDDAVADLSSIQGASNDYEVGNTLQFRIALLYERFAYVVESPSRFITGAGLISDNSSAAARLPFVIGVFNEEMGQNSKIDTGDNLWALLILNLGIVGTVIFIYLYFVKFLSAFKRHMLQSQYAAIGFIIIVNSLITSISGTSMRAYTFVAICYFIYITMTKELQSIQN
ncbi:MAG: hypothetical protein PF541_18010, partial [Prolixibacteraceae bacterium]|nr:hypothetical protein [Prolixibacteraceae bacterium]